ncbi:MAG: polysaccharide deacetylase family protein [Ignavibacteriaceae bacterium]
MKVKEFLVSTVPIPQRILFNMIDTPAVILIYHRVVELESDPQLLTVTPKNFEDHIYYLKNNFNILSPDQFKDYLNGKKEFPPKSLLITFDDGYADNYLNALPVLEKYKAPALFFISTSMLNTKEEMWWDRLDKIFFSGKKLPQKLETKINDKNISLDISSPSALNKTYYSLHQLIKFNKKDVRDEIIDSLFKWSGITSTKRDTYRMMDHDELIKMDKSSYAFIGAHTKTHTPLSILSYDEQFEEVNGSKIFLENLVKHSIKYFSYPFGNRRDYDNQSVEVCRRLDFDFVCANYYSQVHRWTNKYELPRALVRNWDLNYFKKQISKIFNY